jgi:TRAP-type C4-dicarboxylate transport system permease small subunit
MLKQKIDKVVSTILVVIMLALVFDVIWQVFSRFVIRHPSDFTDELAGFLLIWLGLLGSAYASGQKMHLAIDLLLQKSSEVNQKKLNVVINCFIALFALLALIIGGGRFVYVSWNLEQTSSAMQMPMHYVYMVLPISGLLIFYYAIEDIINPKVKY